MARGSLRQRRRGVWELRVYQGRDAATGRQRYATRTVGGSRRHAERELAALVAEVDHARSHAGSVADLLERWFDAASPGWAATTTAHTRSIIDCHLAPHLGQRPVATLTTTDIDDFYAHLLRAGGRGERPLAPGTVARIHSVLHRALAQALRWEWIWINPASQARPPRVPPAEIRPPTPGQVAALLAHVEQHSPLLALFLRLAAVTGARRGQLLGLRWSRVDLERGAVAFTRSLVVGPNGAVLGPTKNHRSHRVELDAHTLHTLVAQHDAATQRATAAGLVSASDAFVFSDDVDGEVPWRPNWATKQFIAARRRAGLGHFRLHDLRHFMATEMLAAGVPLVIVSARLCHARASTTLNVYAHAVPGGDRTAADTIAGLLQPNCRSQDALAYRQQP